MIIPFIKLYVGQVTDTNYIRQELVVLFTIMGLLNCLRTPGATVINAKGHYKETRNRALIEMGICLIFQIALVYKFKIVGVLIATILAYLYRTLDVIIYSNTKILNQSVLNTFKRIFVNLGIMGIMILLVRVNYEFSNYLQWIVGAILVVSIAIVAIVVINIVTNIKTAKDSKEYVINIFRRKSKNVGESN